jgi:transcriptional regulator with XRE-family HTH domain
MKRESAAVQAVDEEVTRLLALLDDLIRLSKRSQRDLEREFGFGNGVLSKILSGQISPKLQHALLIAYGLGLAPAEFFALAYADRKRTEEPPLVRQLKAAEGWQLGEPAPVSASVPPMPPMPDDEQLDRRIEAAVERVLKRRGAGRSG